MKFMYITTKKQLLLNTFIIFITEEIKRDYLINGDSLAKF